MKKTKAKAKLRDERIIDSICTNDKKMRATLQEIVRRIEYYLALEGYSIPEIARVAGISTSVLYRMHNDSTTIGLETLLKLLWVLEIPPEKIIPLYDKNESSYGQKVEELTQCLSVYQKNYILKLIGNIVGIFNVDTNNNGYKNIPQLTYKFSVMEQE